MSRIFHRAVAVAAGMALPMSTWALVAPTNVDDAYADSAYVEVVEDTELSIATVELPGAIDAGSGVSRADKADHALDAALQPEASTTGCCVWVYWHGMWYCYPC